MKHHHHNPGKPISLQLGEEDILGFSIAALSSYTLFPRMRSMVDVGDCPLQAVPLENVFLTHAHGDHARCLLRHEALRRLMGLKPAKYYLPKESLFGFQALVDAWRNLEGLPKEKFPQPNFLPLEAGDTVWIHRQLAVSCFKVQHSLPSLGYTFFDVRKKLKANFQEKTGPELAALRAKGVSFEEENWHPRVCFIGDSTIDTLYANPQVGQAAVLFLELTFLLEEERGLAKPRGHTHLEEFLEFVEKNPQTLKNEHIVFKHFSMRYQRFEVLETLKKRLPKSILKRSHFLI